MTHNKLQTVDNEALTRRYDWTTPGYLPSMLAPAYAPTELHGQHSPPRLMLDDEDSDNDKKRYILLKNVLRMFLIVHNHIYLSGFDGKLF
jgi:hypothetical protein